MKRKTHSGVQCYLYLFILTHAMIAFTRLGKMGQFGNQLFQYAFLYAFLRTTAQRLGVKFYCHEWIGDKSLLIT